MEDPRQAALDLMKQQKVSVNSLWLSYWAHGGNSLPLDFEAYLHGVLDPDEHDPIILCWVLEEVVAP